jgi:hypothetical protein
MRATMEKEEGEGATEDAVFMDIADEDDSRCRRRRDTDVKLMEPRKLRNGMIVGDKEGLEAVDE